MQKGRKAFETLSIDDQKALIDLGIAMSVLIARVPEIQSVIAPALVEAFALHTKVNTNHANYALQDCFDALVSQDWQFIVTKKGVELVTQFIPTRTVEGGNGDTKEAEVDEKDGC